MEMKVTRVECEIDCAKVDQREVGFSELAELELALVGGGSGDVIIQ